MIPLKNISSPTGPMTPPTRKNMKICHGAEGSGVLKSFSGFIPAANNTANKTPAAMPKQTDQIKPLANPGSIFERDNPMAFGFFSNRWAINRRKKACIQRVMPSAVKWDPACPIIVSLKTVSMAKTAAIDAARVFKVIGFASIPGTSRHYTHTFGCTSYRIFLFSLKSV